MSDAREATSLLRTYRPGSEAEHFSSRLARLGVDSGVLVLALQVECLDDVPLLSALQRAVLAEERIAMFRHRAGQAARERREALRRENRDRSVVDIAHELGVSRQAVSKVIAGKESPR